jgi:amino acid adenylation domain-containing protein
MTRSLPTEQERIVAKCVHPTGRFVPFESAAIVRSISERFEQMVALHPGRIAVSTTGQVLTYDELNQRANRVARALLARRGEVNEPIALFIEDRACMIAAILGVLKAGKIYVPVDPSDPQARIAFMLEDSRAALILSDGDNIASADEPGNLEKIRSALSGDNLGLSVAPEALACITYTSGSTGQPKGVMQNHRNVVHKVITATNAFHISVEDRLLLVYSCSFSASILPIFGALLNGATVCAFDVQKGGTAALASWLKEQQVTAYFSVSTLFRHLAESLVDGDAVSHIRLIYVSSEAVTQREVELFRQHFPPHCVFVHMLATGETGHASQYFIDKDTQIEGSVIPVGYEVPDKEILLLDEHGKTIGFNEIGEIAIRSPYLAVGYWQLPDLTQAKFLSDPEDSDQRTYLTGDLGRMLPDGCLYHVGRKDFRVKARGFTIDVSETEAALIALDVVKDAVVVARDDAEGDRRLVAYIVPSAERPTVSLLRRALAEKLPQYMIPSAVVLLDNMPLTATGKIDRRMLPDPRIARPELDRPFVAPRTPIEVQLAQIWSEVLGLDPVGVDDNFFDLGGHSLTAARVVTRAIKHFQLELPLAALFQAPTVADMALVILEAQARRLESSDLDRILSDVEALSEEEAERVLKRALQDPKPQA